MLGIHANEDSLINMSRAVSDTQCFFEGLLDNLEISEYQSEEDTAFLISQAKKLQSSLDFFCCRWKNNLMFINSNEQVLMGAYIDALGRCCADYHNCVQALKRCQEEYIILQALADNKGSQVKKKIVVQTDGYWLDDGQPVDTNSSCVPEAQEKIAYLLVRYQEIAAKRLELVCRINNLLSAQLLQDNSGIDQIIHDLMIMIENKKNVPACCGQPYGYEATTPGVPYGYDWLDDHACAPNNFIEAET